ncbi:hypothetical protein [Pleionea sediminis]|uniref:hypothetical protein n=1 Tax=Pleionea sediminis TaxID=2569479 RepID=UPI0011864FAB|nr:hypothetical protein [Pleionea sediminis]
MAITLIRLIQSKLATGLFIAIALLSFSSSALSSEGNALVLTAKGDEFAKVIQGLSDDIEGELEFKTFYINRESSTDVIEDGMKKFSPKVVILIGNTSINLYTKFQKANPKMQFPPSIALAALFVDRFIDDIKNATGIRYEIPAVISLINMRDIIKKPLKSVGVVHREWMDSIIEENRKYLSAEGIKLISIKLPNKTSNMNKKLDEAVVELVDKKVDAIWVLNDNELLNGRSIGQVWIPKLAKTDIPVLVGVRPLLNTKFNFGSFAIVPDHYALGVQGASIVFELMDNDWDLDGRDISQPISVKKVVNVSVLDNKSIPYDKGKLQTVDEVVK